MLTRPGAVLLVLGLLCLLPACGDESRAPGREPVRYDADGRSLAPIPMERDLPNLLVLVIDSLRRDALTLDTDTDTDTDTDQGRAEGPPPMPFLDGLAQQGVGFSHAVAPSPWTLPSMTSLFTGLRPSEHGQMEVEGSVRLLPAVVTFAEVLSASYGYETAAFVNGPWFSEFGGGGLLQGFETVQLNFTLQGVAPALCEWRDAADPTKPFFAVLHTMEAHDPYGRHNHPYPPTVGPGPVPDTLRGPDADIGAIYRACMLDLPLRYGLFEELGAEGGLRLRHFAHKGWAETGRPELAGELRRAYDEGVRWCDTLVEHTWKQLAELGLLENTLVVVTSDHGEGFGEHGSLGHMRQLYDELVRIPMVFSGPPPFQGGAVVSTPVGLIDVLPTFLDWAGLAPLAGVSGRSMLPAVADDAPCRAIRSEELLTRNSTGDDTHAIRLSARTERWKYILTYDRRTGGVVEEAYDLYVDPEEQDDLAAGAGRLPPTLVFNECFCEAVEEIRGLVWSRTGSEGASYSVPYGTATAPSRGAPPSTCRP